MNVKQIRAHCSVMKALEVIGERWTLLVIREAFYGVRRFEDFLENTGCARNVLATRLITLVDHDVLSKVPYAAEGQRERFEYRLTEKGKALLPVIISLMNWGDAWEQPGKKLGPVKVMHVDCGAEVNVALVCEKGHRLEGTRQTLPVTRSGKVTLSGSRVAGFNEARHHVHGKHGATLRKLAK